MQRKGLIDNIVTDKKNLEDKKELQAVKEKICPMCPRA